MISRGWLHLTGTIQNALNLNNIPHDTFLNLFNGDDSLFLDMPPVRLQQIFERVLGRLTFITNITHFSATHSSNPTRVDIELNVTFNISIMPEILANNFAPRPYRQVHTSNNANGHNIYFTGIPPQARILLLTIRNTTNGSYKTLVIPQVEGNQGYAGLTYELRANAFSGVTGASTAFHERRYRFGDNGGTTSSNDMDGTRHQWLTQRSPNRINSASHDINGVANFQTSNSFVRRMQDNSVQAPNTSYIRNRSGTTHNLNTQTATTAHGTIPATGAWFRSALRLHEVRHRTGIFNGTRHGIRAGFPNHNGITAQQHEFRNQSTGSWRWGDVLFEQRFTDLIQTRSSTLNAKLIARIQHITYNRQNGTLQFHRNRVRRQETWFDSGDWGDTTNLEYILEAPY